ncbi:MAG: type II toxin-antitoxin system HicA family toxin [Phycisphaerae bacterium]|nr:type II toxin-antitoxin system HicA family toxin [Phycisphaerae bacterium]
MKKLALIKQMTQLGWWKYDEGSSHEKWTNGHIKTTIPRHREINELTARAILKLAKGHPGVRNS